MKRVLSFLLCCTLCIGIFAYRPVRVKAVAGVDDAAVVGSMALASYLSATGLELSVIEGGAATVTAGLGAVAGEYAAATGAAASGEAVLGSIAAGTAISTAGTIILTAAAVAACAGLAYWLYTAYFLDKDVDDPASIYSSSGFLLSDGSLIVPLSNSGGFNLDKATHFLYDVTYYTSTGHSFRINRRDDSGRYMIFYHDGLVYNRAFSISDAYPFYVFSMFPSLQVAAIPCLEDSYSQLYDTFFLFDDWSEFYDFFGPMGSFDLSVSLSPDYSIPEIQPTQQMEITIPSAAPGSTLAELVETVPQQIADNEFTVSYTIDDFAPEPAPETSSMLDYVVDIWRKIKELPTTISDAVKSVFEPDAALLQEITTTFNNKFGWLNDIYQLGVDLCNLEPESQPPVIYIHLEDAEGQFRYGGTEKALDMSWYQPYKEDVDNVLSGFMWLAFLWLVFKRAADIINGAGMVSDYEFYMSVPINQPRLGEHKK